MDSVLKFLIKMRSDSGNVLSEARKVMAQLDAIKHKAGGVGESIKKAFAPSTLGASLMAIPGMQLLTNPYTMVASGVGAIAKIGAEVEMAEAAFTNLVGSEREAKSVLDELSKFSDKSPFDPLQLTASAQQMVTAGLETAKVTDYIKRLGDISGGSKQKFDSLSLVMGQVLNAGRLNGQDLIQFLNAGFNPLKELQKMHPEHSYKQLQEAMSKGAISADMVASAIKHATDEGGQFHGMLEASANTLGGRWTSALKSLKKMAVELFKQLRPILSKGLELFSKSIPYVSKALSGLLSTFTAGVNFVKRWWMELALAGSIIGIVTLAINAKTIAITAYAGVMGAVSLATQAWTAMQWLLNLALTANPIGLVIVGVAALTAGIVYLWHKFAGFRAFLITAWDSFKQLGSIIKDYVVDRIHEMLEGLGKVGRALQLLLKGEFSEAWTTFQEGVGGVMGKQSGIKAAQETKTLINGAAGSYQHNLKIEQTKDLKKELPKHPIASPELKGSADLGKLDLSGEGKGKGKGKGHKTAESIATGGARPTTINISIGKLIERLEVTMMDQTDTGDLERAVLQALNRSLAIASSTE